MCSPTNKAVRLLSGVRVCLSREVQGEPESATPAFLRMTDEAGLIPATPAAKAVDHCNPWERELLG